MDSTTLLTAWAAWQLPLLPELPGQSLARQGLWAAVLGGGVGWLTRDWSRRLRLALLVTVLVWVALPGAASVSHWLGLAFKAPSLSSGLLGLFWLVKALRPKPPDATELAGPAPWANALGWLAVLLPMRHPEINAWATLLVCAYPVLEVAFSVRRRRKREGHHPGQPDKAHLHHFPSPLVALADAPMGSKRHPHPS